LTSPLTPATSTTFTLENHPSPYTFILTVAPSVPKEYSPLTLTFPVSSTASVSGKPGAVSGGRTKSSYSHIT